jgi:hypothetical protein
VKSTRTLILGLVALGAWMLVLRIVYVMNVPDLDGDAYGHFHVGRALLDDPRDIPIHWVWLPGWHFVLAALQWIGLSFRGVRLVQAVLATAGPLLVWIHTPSKDDKWLAAAAFTICSLPNLAGTSALMEVVVTLLILGAAIAIDDVNKGRAAPIAAGILLALACTIRYEIWFVVVVGVGVDILVRREVKTRWITFAIPAACIVAYLIFRRSVDGEWLWFIRETYRFTHMQRGLSTRSPLFDLVWFPIVLPFMLLGPAIVLLPIAFAAWRKSRAPLRRSAVIPISLLVFLLATYVGKGALGQARYLTVLMPFACVALARAARVHRLAPVVALLSIAGANAYMTHRNASSALAHADDLHALEQWAASPTTRR